MSRRISITLHFDVNDERCTDASIKGAILDLLAKYGWLCSMLIGTTVTAEDTLEGGAQ